MSERGRDGGRRKREGVMKLSGMRVWLSWHVTVCPSACWEASVSLAVLFGEDDSQLSVSVTAESTQRMRWQRLN